MPEIILNDEPNDIGWVYSIMLFPNDEALREQSYGIDIARFELEKANELKKKWLPPESNDLELALDTRKIATLLLDAPSSTDINKIRSERVKQGYVAGQVLASLYLMYKFNLEEPSMNKAIYITKEYDKKARFGDGSPMPAESKIKEYWKEYMPVAHLWAALELNRNYFFVIDEADCFSNKGFMIFLQIAAEVYNFGINFIPKRARPQKPFLDIEKCWALDNRIKPLTLVSDIKPENMIKILKKYKAPKTAF